MSAKIHTLLFDLDDTLIPSSEIYRSSLEAIGISSDHSKFALARAAVKSRFTRFSTSQHNRLLYFKTLLEQNGEYSPDAVWALNSRYEEELKRKIQMSWVALNRSRLFEELKKHFRMGLVTNENTRTQLLKVSSFDPLGQFFPVLVTSEEMGTEKPDKAMFEEALTRLGSQPDRTMMIGDNWEQDIIPAMQLGFSKVVYTREFTRGDHSPSPGEVVMIQNLSQLMEVLKL